MLTIGADLDEAIDSAYLSYDFHEPAEGEPEEKQAAYRDDIAACIENGVDLLSGLFGGATEEQSVEVSLPGVDLPVYGYIDLCTSTRLLRDKDKGPAARGCKERRHPWHDKGLTAKRAGIRSPVSGRYLC